MFVLHFSSQAQANIKDFKEAGNKAMLKKLNILLNELTEHPTNGTGKPEQLKYELSNCWSRRISKEHRLVYEIVADEVFILSVKGHYRK